MSVLCYASTLGLGQARARDDFPVHGSLRPALRGSDSRFFVGNKAARSLFRGGVRRCVTVGISEEIPVSSPQLDFWGGGCDLGVTDNILPMGFLFCRSFPNDGCTEASLESSPTGSHPPPLSFSGTGRRPIRHCILKFHPAEGSVPDFY